jgi:heat shock protein HtpX
MMRIILFLATNLGVLLVAGFFLNLVENYYAAQGVTMHLQGLLVLCAVFGMSGAFISLLLSKWMAKRGAGVRVIDTPRNASEQWLVNTVAELARDAGIKMPEVGIFPSPMSNAFATGWNKNAALVAVSDGLLQRFKQDETRAVLGHEIGHVAHGDMVTLTLIQGVVNTFVMFFARIIGQMVDRAVSRDGERGGGMAYWIATIFAQIVLGILASMIVMWFSRWREFRADAAGAHLAGRSNMIAALQRLQTEQGIPNDLPENMTAFGISSGLKQGLAKLMMSHPPLEQRIAALRAATKHFGQVVYLSMQRAGPRRRVFRLFSPRNANMPNRSQFSWVAFGESGLHCMEKQGSDRDGLSGKRNPGSGVPETGPAENGAAPARAQPDQLQPLVSLCQRAFARAEHGARPSDRYPGQLQRRAERHAVPPLYPRGQPGRTKENRRQIADAGKKAPDPTRRIHR